ncbi:hypothetical protein [Halalkalicoccus ordinarius]|uniref:hypothetical protein n=1 Tax=Halalkalicoccus ordinarius TaxID=3116651 RepID=UPI00300F696B
MSTAGENDRGFFTFYREYTHTGIHAASTAGLTAFGLLTFVHRAFVVLAIAVYVLPPIYLYLTRDESVETVDSAESNATDDERASTDETTATDAAETSERASVGTAESSKTSKASEPSEAAGGAVLGGDSTATTRPIETTAPAVGGGDAADEDDRPRTDAAAGSTAEDGTIEPVGDSESGERGDEGDEPSESDPHESHDRTRDAEREDETRGTSESTQEPAASGSRDHGTAEPGEPEEEDGGEPTSLEWVEVDSPTDEMLSDVAATDTGAFAVGSDGGLLAREESWETVLDHGPLAESNALRGVDATDDGKTVWFTGDSGALGRYDAETGRHTDHSAPAGITDNWVDVAVAGPAEEAAVYLVNGSGQVLAGEFDGSEVEWGEPVKPGSGSSMSAIEFVEGAGYCCDTNSGVYETTDGESFERIGIEGGGSFTAIAAAGPESLAVADTDGTVQRYDGSVWTPLHAAEVALDALSTDGEDWFAVGDGGTIRELAGGGWEPRETPVETNLHGVAVGEPSVAVGAAGTIIELRPVEDGD